METIEKNKEKFPTIEEINESFEEIINKTGETIIQSYEGKDFRNKIFIDKKGIYQYDIWVKTIKKDLKGYSYARSGPNFGKRVPLETVIHSIEYNKDGLECGGTSVAKLQGNGTWKYFD